jgi:hypothetical protein
MESVALGGGKGRRILRAAPSTIWKCGVRRTRSKAAIQPKGSSRGEFGEGQSPLDESRGIVSNVPDPIECSLSQSSN